MLKMFKFSAISLVILNATNLYGGTRLPIYPAETVGRDLQTGTGASLGHIGVTGGTDIGQETNYVVEVLNPERKGDDVVVRNFINSDFKRRAKYWGSRWGIYRTNYDAYKIVTSAYDQMNYEHDYTLTTIYKPGSPGHKGKFRCDTFVIFAFATNGYLNFEKLSWFPRTIFNAFPNSNNDAFKAVDNITPPLLDANDTLMRDLQPQELNKMPENKFLDLIKTSTKDSTPLYIKKEWEFAQDNSVDVEKRIAFIDKLSDIKDDKSLVKFINFYKVENNKNIKDKIISNILYYAQSYIDRIKESKERTDLICFYEELLSTDFDNENGYDILRGIIDFHGAKDVMERKDELNEYINKLDAHSSLDLLITAMQKSKETAETYIDSLITFLNKEKKYKLDSIFFNRVLNDLQDFDSAIIKEKIKNYLLDEKSRYGKSISNANGMSEVKGDLRFYDLAKNAYSKLEKVLDK